MNSLHQLALKSSQVRSLSAHEPFELIDQGGFWIVLQGGADLFVQEPNGRRNFVASFEKDALLFGLKANGENSLIAVGIPNTQIARLEWSDLYATAKEEPDLQKAFIDSLQNWILSLSCAGDQMSCPVTAEAFDGESWSLDANGVLHLQGGLKCVQVEQGGLSAWGMSGHSLQPVSLFPCGQQIWLKAGQPSEGKLLPLSEIVEFKKVHAMLAGFHHAFLLATLNAMESARCEFSDHYQEENKQIRKEWGQSLKKISDITSVDSEPSNISALDDTLAVLQYIGAKLKIKVRAHADMIKGIEVENPLQKICQASRFKVRRVTLESGWHRENAGMLLGYLGDKLRPVALIR